MKMNPRKPLVELAGTIYEIEIAKLSRAALYGERIRTPELPDGTEAKRAMMLDNQIVVSDSTLSYRAVDGRNVKRPDVALVDEDGNRLKLVGSMFSNPKPLSSAQAEGFVAEDVYVGIVPDEVKAAGVVGFEFAWNDTYSPRQAIIVSGEKGGDFILVGHYSLTEMVNLASACVEEAPDEVEEEDDEEFTFDM